MHAIECSECKVKRQLVSWNWAYTWLGAAWWGCWELNSCPLEEHQMLLTTEPSLYPVLFVFNQINPIVKYYCLSVKMVKIKTVTHQTLAKVHSDWICHKLWVWKYNVPATCNGNFWLSTWLHLEWSKTQAAGNTYENFFSFEVGSPTFNPGFPRWEDQPVI